jgi:hypothetical protein
MARFTFSAILLMLSALSAHTQASVIRRGAPNWHAMCAPGVML